ncbi:6-aminohexanoate-dimer hydrolase [Saccharicrinis fermentans DSM 9555 = JCM 21142]|uniref:6-aminohexanoate-dimer hydrolase n=2 Tax=Saccharicrinis fermentans TaxID=982 RepID=W7Y3I7_9BACT|nr:6-aminohexanoate-dimer hydrolase [Saccharicrinis fermentans DSM 9555 = JCM 21142]
MRKFVIGCCVLVGILGITYAFLPYYAQNALVNLFPGIDDYHIFDNRTVRAARPNPWGFSQDYMQFTLLPHERDSLEHYESVAYLIIQDDSIVYEEYWDEYNEQSLSNSFSAAKSIVSLLIGAAIMDGYIDNVNQYVGDFIPEYKEKPNDQLKIKDLLTMSSGLNWQESYTSPFSITTQAYYGKHVNQLVRDLKVVEKPGVAFNYKSGNTQLLALILKNAVGKSLSDYASEKLWVPLGAENDALWSMDQSKGDEKAYCCFNSNARDFARIGKVVLHKGNINGQQLITEKYMTESITPASYLVDHEDKEEVDFYGYQWWLLNLEGEQIPYARGIYGQYIIVLKNENAIVVRLGHKRSKVKIHHHPSDLYAYVLTAKRILHERNHLKK